MISSEQQAELRAKYNPDGSNLRRMQLHILEMLKYIDKVCRENNIKYCRVMSWSRTPRRIHSLG